MYNNLRSLVMWHVSVLLSMHQPGLGCLEQQGVVVKKDDAVRLSVCCYLCGLHALLARPAD